MIDTNITLKQIGELVQDAVKPVVVRLDRVVVRLDRIEDRMTGVENRMTGVEDRMTGVENRMIGVEDRMNSVEEKLDGLTDVVTEMKIDLDVIKDDYIGQVEEIRSHVGLSPLIKHKAV